LVCTRTDRPWGKPLEIAPAQAPSGGEAAETSPVDRGQLLVAAHDQGATVARRPVPECRARATARAAFRLRVTGRTRALGAAGVLAQELLVFLLRPLFGRLVLRRLTVELMIVELIGLYVLGVLRDLIVFVCRVVETLALLLALSRS